MKSRRTNNSAVCLLNQSAMKVRTSLLFFCSTLLPSLIFSCARNRDQIDYSELLPIFSQNNLTQTVPSEQHREVADIEEADARLYAPRAGKTIYLASPATFDSRDTRPRYWLRVEDYPTAEAAAKRASEYAAVGTYDRIEKAYGKGSLYISKNSVRLWAIARGKRVYALTTDSSFLTYIELPKTLRKSIAQLPET